MRVEGPAVGLVREFAVQEKQDSHEVQQGSDTEDALERYPQARGIRDKGPRREPLQLNGKPLEVQPQQEGRQHRYEGHEELGAPNQKLEVHSINCCLCNVKLRPLEDRLLLRPPESGNAAEVHHPRLDQLGQGLQNGKHQLGVREAHNLHPSLILRTGKVHAVAVGEKPGLHNHRLVVQELHVEGDEDRGVQHFADEEPPKVMPRPRCRIPRLKLRERLGDERQHLTHGSNHQVGREGAHRGQNAAQRLLIGKRL
mmetsp:Transcript_119123/g.282640  ORF Transcript_119123/g.282640 Transcript_119123/m.282640 type:complete len:255 (+) Transcript_119123:332-1096(+)